MYRVLKERLQQLAAKRYLCAAALMLCPLFFCIVKYWHTKTALLGGAVCILALCMFGLLVYLVFRCTGVLDYCKSLQRGQLLGLIGIMLLGLGALICVLMRQRRLMFWDCGEYWSVSINISNLMFEHPLQQLRALYASINDQEYNNLIPVLIALPLRVFGTSYVAYAIINFTMFLVPAFLAVLTLINNIWNKLSENHPQHFYMTLLIVMTNVGFYMPLYNGYLDVFSLLCLALVYLLICSTDFSVFDWKKDVLLAISLVLTFMGRRYFAFGVMGVAAAVIITAVADLIRNRLEKKRLLGYVFNALFLLVVGLVPLLIVFRPFVMNSLFGNIRFAYSAYQDGSLLYNYEALAAYMGPVCIAFALIGSIYIFAKKKSAVYEGLLLLVSLLVSTWMFYQVQSMACHHYYITIIPVVVLSAIGVNVLVSGCRFGRQLLCLFIGLHVYIVLDGTSVPDILEAAFTDQRLQPVIRNDVDTLRLLTSELRGYSDEGSSIYMIASSSVINDDVIRKINLPDELQAVPSLMAASQVDLRDGFSLGFLQADYVVVADPVQYHLSPEDQRVVGILADEFINHGRIGEHFEEVSAYHIDDDITLTVYKRVEEYTDEDRQYLADIYNQYYGDYPELFQNRIFHTDGA